MIMDLGIIHAAMKVSVNMVQELSDAVPVQLLI